MKKGKNKLSKKSDDRRAAFRSDESLDNMLSDLTHFFELDNKSQTIRFAIKRLHRKHILNKKVSN